VFMYPLPYPPQGKGLVTAPQGEGDPLASLPYPSPNGRGLLTAPQVGWERSTRAPPLPLP
jgi:hypothetical protein